MAVSPYCSTPPPAQAFTLALRAAIPPSPFPGRSHLPDLPSNPSRASARPTGNLPPKCRRQIVTAWKSSRRSTSRDVSSACANRSRRLFHPRSSRGNEALTSNPKSKIQNGVSLLLRKWDREETLALTPTLSPRRGGPRTVPGMLTLFSVELTYVRCYLLSTTLGSSGYCRRTASAKRSRTSNVVSQPIHASVTLWP